MEETVKAPELSKTDAKSRTDIYKDSTLTVLLRSLREGELAPSYGGRYPTAEKFDVTVEQLKGLERAGILVADSTQGVLTCKDHGGSMLIAVALECKECHSRNISKGSQWQHACGGFYDAGDDNVFKEQLSTGVPCLLCKKQMSTKDTKMAGKWYRCNKCDKRSSEDGLHRVLECNIGKHMIYSSETVLASASVYRLTKDEQVRNEIFEMDEAASAVADAFESHGFTTKRYAEVKGASGEHYNFEVSAEKGSSFTVVRIFMGKVAEDMAQYMLFIATYLDIKSKHGNLFSAIIATPSAPEDAKKMCSANGIQIFKGKSWSDAVRGADGLQAYLEKNKDQRTDREPALSA